MVVRCALRPQDALHQFGHMEAGQVTYMLANGNPKARMNREGGNRSKKQWCLVFLRSGEQGLEDKLGEDGKRVRAGQELRVTVLPQMAMWSPTLGNHLTWLLPRLKPGTALVNYRRPWPRKKNIKRSLVHFCGVCIIHS